MRNRIELYQRAKKGNENVVVIEGVHAFKHAMRFGAEIIDAVTSNKKEVMDLMNKIATVDDVENVEKYATEIDEKLFKNITTDSLRTGITALAKKPNKKDVSEQGLIVFLENPRNIDNVGAVIRVCAGAGVDAVCVSGEVNPWHLYAIRAGAGLHFALDIKHISNINEIVNDQNKIYVCDANGEEMTKIKIERNSILVFGTERNGVSKKLKKKSDKIISIPMQKGVSSLNLATSVSAVLYGGRFE